MKETDCRKCCVCAFKEDLCNGDFCEKYYREGNTEDFEKLLPHWIPCSERLPEEYEYVLLCDRKPEPDEDTGYSRMAVGWLEDGKFCCWDDRVARKNLSHGCRSRSHTKEGKQNEETD